MTTEPTAAASDEWKGRRVKALDVVGVPVGGLGTIISNSRMVGGYPARVIAWDNGRETLTTVAKFKRVTDTDGCPLAEHEALAVINRLRIAGNHADAVRVEILVAENNRLKAQAIGLKEAYRDEFTASRRAEAELDKIRSQVGGRTSPDR